MTCRRRHHDDGARLRRGVSLLNPSILEERQDQHDRNDYHVIDEAQQRNQVGNKVDRRGAIEKRGEEREDRTPRSG